MQIPHLLIVNASQHVLFVELLTVEWFLTASDLDEDEVGLMNSQRCSLQLLSKTSFKVKYATCFYVKFMTHAHNVFFLPLPDSWLVWVSMKYFNKNMVRLVLNI